MKKAVRKNKKPGGFDISGRKEVRPMPRGMMDINFKGFEEVQKKLKNIEKQSAIVTKRTISDIKKRAPGWVATSVTKTYNIKKAEILGSQKNKKPIGKVKVEGETIDELQLVFEGRLLTPVHFGMTPKKPPAGGKSYILKAQFFKGKQVVIGRYNKKKIPGGPYSERSHNILMPTGASSPEKVPYIPFQRMSKNRKDIKKFTTLSVPQMITNEEVSKDIRSTLNENIEKRLDHHMQSAMKRL